MSPRLRDGLELLALALIAVALVHTTMGVIYYGLLLALRGDELLGLLAVSGVVWGGMFLTAYMTRLS